MLDNDDNKRDNKAPAMAPGPPPTSYNWLSLDHTPSSKFKPAQVIIANVP